MIVFPQLTTGAIGQYPVVKRRKYKPVANLLLDGSAIGYSDASPRMNAWDMTFRDLTDSEASTLQSLFQAVEGRRGTFTFIDPTANLLAHSEELDDPSWTKDPLIQLTTGVDDPVGGNHAIRLVNEGQGGQSLSQTLSAPAWFSYSFSAYARSAGGSWMSLTRSSTSNAHTRMFPLGPGWTRCTLSGALTAADEAVQFAVNLAAGALVELYGIQVDAQPAPSAYKRSGNRNGVFSNARFDSDVLQQVTDGPDQHRFVLRVVAKD